MMDFRERVTRDLTCHKRASGPALGQPDLLHFLLNMQLKEGKIVKEF